MEMADELTEKMPDHLNAMRVGKVVETTAMLT